MKVFCEENEKKKLDMLDEVTPITPPHTLNPPPTWWFHSYFFSLRPWDRPKFTYNVLTVLRIFRLHFLYQNNNNTNVYSLFLISKKRVYSKNHQGIWYFSGLSNKAVLQKPIIIIILESQSKLYFTLQVLQTHHH